MKIRVGFGPGTIAAAGLNAPTFWDVVDACESGGWDSIWFSERVTSDAPDPLAAMAAVAGRTRRLKFGPSVVVLPGRNPVLLASELATIDVLSAGRLVAAFGLGVDAPAERAVFGVAPEERAARTDEAVELIRRLWTEERVTFEGRFFRVRDATVGPRPVQKPHPDIWFGGISGPALRRVGRLGDGWLPSFITVAEYKPKADVIRSTAEQAGRRIDEEHFGALIPYLPATDLDPEPILAAVGARRPGVDPRDVLVTEGHEFVREQLAAFVEQGASKFVVVPVVPPRDWVAELAALRSSVAVPLEN